MGWVGRCVSGVGIVLGKLWMYPHSATPRIPTQSPYNTKSSPPTAYARLARPHVHHLAQTHTHHTYPTSIPPNSTPESTLLQPTQPDPRPYKNAPYTIPQTDTPYPLPTTPTPTSQPDPTTPPYPPHILSYPPNPYPSYPYMPTPPQRLSSVLARRTCH